MIVTMLVLMAMAMLMRVLVVMLQLLLAMYQHTHMCSGDSRGDGRLGVHLHAGQAQAVHHAEEILLVVQQLIQGAHEHIARRAHGTFKIQGFHGAPPILPSG